MKPLEWEFREGVLVNPELIAKGIMGAPPVYTVSRYAEYNREKKSYEFVWIAQHMVRDIYCRHSVFVEADPGEVCMWDELDYFAARAVKRFDRYLLA